MLNNNNIYTIAELKEMRDSRNARSLSMQDWDLLMQDIYHYNKNITIKTDKDIYSVTCTKTGHNKTCNPILIYCIYINGVNVSYWFSDCVDSQREVHNTYIKTTNFYITDKIVNKIINN